MSATKTYVQSPELKLISELAVAIESARKALAAGNSVGAMVELEYAQACIIPDSFAEHPEMRCRQAAPELLEACKALLATGLNGGNNVRLAFLAASQHELSAHDLAIAEASEQAVNQARAAIAKATKGDAQ